MTSRLKFRFQRIHISIEHWNHSFKFSDLLINCLYFLRVLIEASAFGLQLLYKYPQPRRHVSVAFVFLRYSQIHLLQQLQLVVRALTKLHKQIVCLSRSTNNKIKSLEKQIGKRKTWSSDLTMANTLVKRSLSDSASSSRLGCWSVFSAIFVLFDDRIGFGKHTSRLFDLRRWCTVRFAIVYKKDGMSSIVNDIKPYDTVSLKRFSGGQLT